MACKVEEYYVSIQNFASNCSLMPKEACEKVVRDNELLVMLKLHYHLTIYKPYKAIDGFLLDIGVTYFILNDPRYFNAISYFI